MRTMAQLVCAGCGVSFTRLASEARKSRTHFHDAECARLHQDHRSAGAMRRTVGQVPLEKRLERSRLAGLARARNVPKERLSEIARLGVAARRRRQAEVEAMRRSWVGVLVPVYGAPGTRRWPR